MSVVHRPQLGLRGVEETEVIEDRRLETELIDRDRKNAVKLASAKAFKSVDETVKDRIKELKIHGTVRCGGFLITVKTTEGRSVEFDTKPSKRITIRPVKE